MFENEVIAPILNSINKFGTHNAFCINDKFYTYNEFSESVSKIRTALKKEDAVSKNIGLIANDDLETYSAIFAIWLQGYAYVPLHPQQPCDRTQEIISQAEIGLVICSDNKYPLKDVNIINSGELEFTGHCLQPEFAPENAVAYILFTSGSTGKPKGVPIMRSNVGAFIKSFFEVGFEINHTDRCLQVFDLTFDVSVQSFLTPLIRGACVYTIPHDRIKYSYVYGLLEDHKVTFGAMAPSMLRYLRPYFDELNAESMKYCILTAEASPVDLVKEWSACIPNATIYDFYGPTEATIYCTYYRFNREGVNKQVNGMLSIGKAMNGLKAIIIDDSGNILGPNQKGEMCIAGAHLTPGYWENPERTAEAFFECELEGINYRFYKTGDICYYDEEGDIMYSGRIDSQVKIQGFRIELGEIEYHARECLNGQNAIAVAFENKTGNTEIALFVEGIASNTDLNALDVYLKLKMPYYMIPTKIVIQDKFPLNANGKTDRSVLKKSIIQYA